jgi:RimJ/RimL family protein N-acetyltransferase
MTVITTPRLVLRAPQERDIPDLVRGLNNYNVSQWTARIPFPYGERDAAEFVRHTREASSGVLRLAIEQAGTAIGVIGCERTADGAAAELGYWLAEPHWGKGYGREAAQAMTAHAFSSAGHDRLVAGYREGNEASRRILDALGFEATGRQMVFSAAVNANMPVVRMVLAKQRWLEREGRRP